MRSAAPMRRIQVPITDPQARRALVNLAEREMRDPRDQAAILILEGLRQRNLLPEKNVNRSDQAETVTA